MDKDRNEEGNQNPLLGSNDPHVHSAHHVAADHPLGSLLKSFRNVLLEELHLGGQPERLRFKVYPDVEPHKISTEDSTVPKDGGNVS